MSYAKWRIFKGFQLCCSYEVAPEEGATVDKGTVIGYIAAPTKYYSEEGSNLYFAMKKDGEPVDPIAYLPE